MKATLRQPRVPVLESWIEETLVDSDSDDQSALNARERDPYSGSEPILSSCMRPRAEGVAHAAETLRPTGESARPSGLSTRRSDPRELSRLLEGDEELDLLGFYERLDFTRSR